MIIKYIAIDKTVKDAFRDFCISNFPGRIIECNDFDDYIRVQEGNHFKDYLHYEYGKNKQVQLHIEFDEKEENDIFYQILSSFGGCKNLSFVSRQKGYYEWGTLNNPQNQTFDVTQQISSTSNDIQPVLEQFYELQKEVEPYLRKIEFFIRKYWNF